MTLPSRAYRIGDWLLCWGLMTACSSSPPLHPRDVADASDTGRVLAATTESERNVLHELPALQSGKELTVGDTRVVAEQPYSSASGKTCRALQMTRGSVHAASHRLACSAGGNWYFVPDVFSGNVAAR